MTMTEATMSETASQARYDLMQADIARTCMTTWPKVEQARRIARHYMAHALIAEQLHRLTSDPMREQEVLPMVEAIVANIKRNHLVDFGIPLEW